MAEQKSIPDNELNTPEAAQGLSFSPQDIKAEMSYFLKQEPHKLPKPSVDYLLSHFGKLVKQDREGEAASLQSVLMELVIIAINNPSGPNSPRYIAVADFARSKGVEIGEFVQEAPAAAQIAEQTAGAAAAVLGDARAEQPTVDFSTEEVSSSVRGKFADIMSMDPPDAIRALFPSIPGMILNVVVLKILQGATLEEKDDFNWHVNFFADLVQKFPSLQEDLDKQGITLQSAARTLLARGQKEANRSTLERTERLKGRGKLATIQGIHVTDLLDKTVAMELALAGTKPSKENAPAPAEIAVFQKPEAAAVPVSPAPVIETPAVQEKTERSRVTSIPTAYDAQELDSQKDIATVQVDTRAVREHLVTVPHMDAYVPPEAIGSDVPAPADTEDSLDERSQRLTMPAPEETAPSSAPTAPPEKSKKKRGKGFMGKIGKLFGGNEEE